MFLEELPKDIYDFYLSEEQYLGKKFLVSDFHGINLEIKKNGYVPKSGLIFIRFLNGIKIHGNVIDIGTGETGILAYYLKIRGAENVTACDVDIDAIIHASKASEIGKEINWIVCDTLDPINRSLKFDIIVSNPPQMPMQFPGKLHDYGGLDGRDVINKLVKNAKNYLADYGKMYLLCFDFLSIIKKYGHDNTLISIANENGLELNVVAKFIRKIRKGGETEKNLQWINKTYPLYKFHEDKMGNLIHRIYIVRIVKILK